MTKERNVLDTSLSAVRQPNVFKVTFNLVSTRNLKKVTYTLYEFNHDRLSHKTHNAPVPYPTIRRSEQKFAYLNGVLWDRCIVGFVRLVYFWPILVVSKSRFNFIRYSYTRMENFVLFFVRISHPNMTNF